MYEIFEMLCSSIGVTPYKVCKDTGITTATISSWKAGRYTPKRDKMQILADYFGVSVDYLMTGKEPENAPAYYLNEETAQIAQEIFENPGLRILFDASRGSSPEDISLATDLLIALKKKGSENYDT